MEYLCIFFWLLSSQFFVIYGLKCLQDEACVRGGSLFIGRKVDNITYCCEDPSYLMDMTPRATPGGLTCQCTTSAQAAAAYANRTMQKGYRMCHWGPVCDGVKERLKLNGSNDTFCCPGDNQYVHTRHFGARQVVCHCRGSSLPPKNPHRYFPPPTGNASDSGEQCSYNDDCRDNPSISCPNDVATFCCYGSRGLETVNDANTNSTRCTCSNDFMGTRCTAALPFAVLNSNVRDTECSSGDACKEMSPSHTCSHGSTEYCCPNRGINVTLLNDIISSCTCISTGRQCNITFTSSNAVTCISSRWFSAIISAWGVLTWKLSVG